ncbi:hypothetical protein Ga0466249_003254 [Sporomusaceae bacterium BoRhaA]|nr:hypothetical protein [Pelorhabdus rhamnosifermentans]
MKRKKTANTAVFGFEARTSDVLEMIFFYG